MRRAYLFILFISLEGAAVYVYVNTDSYARAKILSWQSSVTGVVDYGVRGVVDYFSLRSKNRELLERVVYLEQQMMQVRGSRRDSILMARSYYDESMDVWMQSAYVVSNTINRKHNYLIVNRGLQDGVRAGMGVVTPNLEMVGVILECSDRYAVVMSTINTRFRTSGEIEGDGYAGSVYWGGRDRYRMRMSDLSKYAAVTMGDHVVTTSFSQVFPAGVTIGYVAEVHYDQQRQSYRLDVDLAADISRVDEVMIINYNAHAESQVLMNRIERDFDGDYPDLMGRDFN